MKKFFIRRPLLKTLLRSTLLACVLASTSAAAPTSVLAGVSDAGADATLALIYRDIRADKLDVALQRTDELLKIYPNFRLAYLIRGDLLLAKGAPLTTMGNVKDAPADRLKDLRDEAIVRLRAYRQRPPMSMVPRDLIQLRDDQKFALVADTRQSRLYVYRNEKGRPVFVTDYYISQGRAGAAKLREGDLKTPIGVYQVTGHLLPAKLGDFYGTGAYPINYPNPLDRIQGRDGYGIWLHGVPSDTYSRPPLASEGCIVLANQDLTSLGRFVQTGLTPVIISDQVQWLSLDSWQAERKSLGAAIEAWRADWQGMNTDRYLSHYAANFKSQHGDLARWSKDKRFIASTKTWLKVDVRNIGILRSPGKEDVVEVLFDQDYRSNNLQDQSRKRQYWAKQNGHWKIIYEGSS